MCHLLCGGLGALFIFIFGALRSKDAIKISAPRAARQGLISTGRNRRGMGSPSISAPTPCPPPLPPTQQYVTLCVICCVGAFPSPFYLYFYKDKNKEKGMNCAKAPYRRDMGEMGGNGGGTPYPKGLDRSFLSLFLGLCVAKTR